MDAAQVFSVAQSALFTLLTVAAPVLAAVLVVGILVSVFQAATQIHESTLSFVPKLVAAFAVLALVGPWMLNSIVEYLQRTIQSIPSVVG